jgi:MoxR-like ATPase
MTDAIEIQKHTPPIDLDAMTRPQGYVMEDNDLRAAANAALMLGKPLLLTGEAGVGKSQFSAWLAHQLGLGDPLKFVVKSTTEARDLFYHYDALARFHEAQVTQLVTVPVAAGDKPLGGSMDEIDPRRYIAYNALGKAILYSLGALTAREKGFISKTMGALLDDFPLEPRRSVVLIDEIDKAPRDVPNDILDEIDNLSFTIRELGNITVKASKTCDRLSS